MNKKLFLLICLTMLSYFLFGQEINIYKTFGGYRFERDSAAISPKMVLEILKDNPLAYAEFKSAKTNYGISSALKFTGGLLILIPVASAIIGGDPEWGLAAGGLGLALASIPFNASFKNHALNALDTYNAGLTSRRIKVNFYLAGNGGRLIIRF